MSDPATPVNESPPVPESPPGQPPEGEAILDEALIDPIIRQALEEFEGGLARTTSLRVRPHWDFAAFRERLWDLVWGSLAIAVLSPFFLLAAILTRWGSPGPIIFRQKRLGKHGVPFDILKFRSMRVDAERFLREHTELYRRYVQNNFKLDLWEDPRISPFGRFLRRSKLDELPQLWNVLRGDMSLVGPRPIVPPEIVNYGIYSRRLLSVKPGVTGYWQVTMGGEMGYPRRVVLDMYYVEHKSRRLDVWILVKTGPAICYHFWKNRKKRNAGKPA
ncbi:MAG: sugar transferase [Verrucomicrobia bacterium]|nr:sugar transferase [Verrucomicrobiota bacterium]